MVTPLICFFLIISFESDHIFSQTLTRISSFVFETYTMALFS